VVNIACLVAVGVNNEGQREVLGLDLATVEDGAGWTAFLRSLVARGLSWVQLVVSDAHTGLVDTIAGVLPGTAWQRCRTHWGRKDSTWRRRCIQIAFVLGDDAQDVGGGGVGSLGSRCGVSVLVQQGADHWTALLMVRRLTWNRSATTSRLDTLRRHRIVARTRSASVIFSEKIPPRAPNFRSAPRWRCLRRSASASWCKDSRPISLASSGRLIPVSAGSPRVARRFGRVGTLSEARKSCSAAWRFSCRPPSASWPTGRGWTCLVDCLALALHRDWPLSWYWQFLPHFGSAARRRALAEELRDHGIIEPLTTMLGARPVLADASWTDLDGHARSAAVIYLGEQGGTTALRPCGQSEVVRVKTIWTRLSPGKGSVRRRALPRNRW
jgi:hypothetical protein